MIILVPPCGFASILCLVLAQRSRRNCGGDTATANCLERISYTAVAIAFCVLIAASFAEKLHYAYLLNLASSNCSAVGKNGTVLSPTVRPSLSPLLVNMNDPRIKQRFVLSDNPSVLQSPVDMKFTVLRNSVDILPIPRHHIDSSFASSEP